MKRNIQMLMLGISPTVILSVFLLIGSPFFVVRVVVAVPINPVVDGYARDTNGDGVFETLITTSSSISATSIPVIPFKARAFMEFDISSFTQGTLVTDAVLSVSLSGGSSLPMTLMINGYIGDGLGSVADVLAGTLLISQSITPALLIGTQVSFDFTAFVQGLVNQGEAYVGFNFRTDETFPSPRNISFSSTESSSVALFPELSVTTAPVPEPTTMLLLGIGLVGLAGTEVRRRRKKKAVDKG